MKLEQVEDVLLAAARILAETVIRARLAHTQNVLDGDVARAGSALDASLR